MDELQEMDFEGGIETLDLSAVGNAEEVGASTLLPSVKPLCNNASGQSAIDDGLQHLSPGNNTTNDSNDPTENFMTQKPTHPTHLNSKSADNVEIGVDFDVDSFLNPAHKTSRDVHEGKVSTVIHYVPATEMNCGVQCNANDNVSIETDVSRRCIHSGSGLDETDTNLQSLEDVPSTTECSKYFTARVVSANSTALHKQNKMAKGLMGLRSLMKDLAPQKVQHIIPGKGIILTIDCDQNGGVNLLTDNSGKNGNVKFCLSGNERLVSSDTISGMNESTYSTLCNDDVSAITDHRLDRFDPACPNSQDAQSPGVILDEGLKEVVEYNIHIDDSQKIKDEEGNTKWSCNICSGTYASRHNLVTHILSHSDIRPHYCLVCGKMFRQLSHLQTHLLTHGNNRPHTCHVCKRAFTQLSHLKRHLITHQDQQTIACKSCGRGFAYASELKAHEAKHEEAKARNCPECGQSFDTNRKFKHHISTAHSKSRNLICKECNKVFNYPSQLRDHMLTHSGKRAFECDKCDMKFMKEHHLRAHQVTHSDIRPYTCPTCSRSFNQHGNLQRHMLIHAQEKQFRCKVCGKAFAQQQVLNTHLLTHSNEKPHKCNVCGKGFTRSHNLKAHMTMHKDKKPHSCLCGASFTVRGNLNRHRKQYHGLNGKISLEEEAAFILNSMSNKTKPSENSEPENTNQESKVEIKI